MSQSAKSRAAKLPAREKTELDAAVAEAKQEAKIIEVLGREFTLMPKVSLVAATDLDEAQRDEHLLGIIKAASKLIVPAEREAFLAWLLEESDDPDNVIDLDDFLRTLESAMEAISGRPPASAAP